MSSASVNIVESLTPQDRAEGEMLSQSLGLAGLPCTYASVGDLSEFADALREISSPVAGYTVLHLSCHGCQRGIVLASGKLVTWYELRRLLVPLNRAASGNLLLCVSACRGLYATGMALDPNDLPFHAVIGPASDVLFPDSAVAFVVFYHQLFKGASLDRAVEVMRVASSESSFDISDGAVTREALLAAMAEIERGA